LSKYPVLFLFTLLTTNAYLRLDLYLTTHGINSDVASELIMHFVSICLCLFIIYQMFATVIKFLIIGFKSSSISLAILLSVILTNHFDIWDAIIDTTRLYFFSDSEKEYISRVTDGDRSQRPTAFIWGEFGIGGQNHIKYLIFSEKKIDPGNITVNLVFPRQNTNNPGYVILGACRVAALELRNNFSTISTSC
jgi:hypothetical protein